jgi:hypothetical protein
MAKVVAGITMSIDGYVTGPNDGPGNGLGDGGELDLEQLGVRQSPFATFIDYRIKGS